MCPFINGYCKADMCMSWNTTVEKEFSPIHNRNIYLESKDRKGICLRLSLKEKD